MLMDENSVCAWIPVYTVSHPKGLKSSFGCCRSCFLPDLEVIYFWRNSPQWAMASSFTRFLDFTQRRTTVGRAPLDEWSARRRDLYLTTHNTQNRQVSMSPVEFKPTVSVGERPQTYALDRVATGTGCLLIRYSFVSEVRRPSYKNRLMHSFIIYITLLALCYSNMFRSSNGHLQGVGLVHFHSQINKMCTRYKI